MMNNNRATIYTNEIHTTFIIKIHRVIIIRFMACRRDSSEFLSSIYTYYILKTASHHKAKRDLPKFSKNQKYKKKKRQRKKMGNNFYSSFSSIHKLSMAFDQYWQSIAYRYLARILSIYLFNFAVKWGEKKKQCSWMQTVAGYLYEWCTYAVRIKRNVRFAMKCREWRINVSSV